MLRLFCVLYLVGLGRPFLSKCEDINQKQDRDLGVNDQLLQMILHVLEDS